MRLRRIAIWWPRRWLRLSACKRRKAPAIKAGASLMEEESSGTYSAEPQLPESASLA